MGVNAVPVSKVVNPVTQTALVAVKSASIKLIGTWVEIGAINNKHPVKMIIIKLNVKSCAGL